MAYLDTLTGPQLAVVQDRSLPEEDLPEYYDSVQRIKIKISRDFEAYLILAPDNVKVAATKWIENASALQETNKTRDALTQLRIQQELSNAKLALDAYDIKLNVFNDFRTSFEVNEITASIFEVQRFIGDLQAAIGEMIVGRERAFFDQTLANVVQAVEGNGLTSDQLQELQSWTEVLSKYIGG